MSRTQGDRATVPSYLDHYIHRPNSAVFQNMTLLHFAGNFRISKEIGSNPKSQKMKIVIVRPHCSPDPDCPKYDQYCQQKLMLHVPFRLVDDLKGSNDTFTAAYAIFLQSGNIPQSLEEDIRRLEEHRNEQIEEDDEGDNEVY